VREINVVAGSGSVHEARVNAMLADSWTKAHMDAAKRDELAKKLAWMLKSLESKGNREDLRRLQYWLRRLFEEARSAIPGNQQRGFTSFGSACEKIEEVLASDENKKILGAELAKYEKDLADVKAEYAKAMADERFKDVEERVKKIQDMLDGKVEVQYWTHFEGALKNADEALAKCPKQDARYGKFQAKLAEQHKAYEAKHAAGDKAEIIDPAVKYWTYCLETYKKDTDGWEAEEGSKTLADYRSNELGCKKTENLCGEIVQRFFEDDRVKKASAQYANDPALKPTLDQAVAMRDKACGKLIGVAKRIVDLFEKLPPGDERKNLEGCFYNFKNELNRFTKGHPEHEAVCARIDAVEKKWKGDVAAAEGAKEALTKSLEKSVNDAWPAMLAAFSVKKLDAPEAIANPGSWKGTYIHFSGGSRGVNLNRSGWDYDDQYYFIVERDGIPICGSLDGGLEEAIKKVEKTTGVALANDEEVVGVIDGTCKVYTLFHYDNGNKSMRDRLCDGIRMRIVALKGVTIAAAVGQGTNLKSCPEFKDKEFSVSESGSSSSTGGRHSGGGGFSFIHFIHRFVAWGMCLLLVICGALAAAHGASKFVPQIQEQKAKLGDYLGYAGIGFGVAGLLWFGTAFVLPLIFEDVRFGSLPSIAMILAGAFVGADLARTKGKLKEETAVMIQPLGILLGLGCFGAAALHFFLWDWRFF